MGFLDFDINDAVEPTAVAGDQEYKIRIVDCRKDYDKNDKPYLLPRFEIPGEPTAKDFTRFLRLPHAGQSPKEMNNTKWTLKNFGECFDVDLSQLNDPTELIGAEGWAILGLEESDQWGQQNTVKKFLAGK